MIITQPDRLLLAQQIARYAPTLRGIVLDIGAGRVRRYQRLCVNVKEYLTLDVAAKHGPDIVGSAEAIPLPDASIDGILCTQVLEHVPHPHVALREMHRVLRSGGICLLTVPQFNELHEEPHDYFRYTCFGLRSLLDDAGLHIDAMDQRGAYHCTLTQLRIRHLVNTWRPYDRRWSMWILAPLTSLLTHYAVLRDRLSRNPAGRLHTIGWCVLAHKP